ncbi:HNH endonuclease [Streptomyces sp. NPDC014656]|uniref:HNH endonuclease n=1 Tax=Streptomyces sp. NPDC014656 TaxID=3364878 RepID=UPI0036F6E5EB
MTNLIAMTIDRVGKADGEEGGTDGVQWLLQPRGTARTGGPKHFEHSVRTGIDLAQPRYADVLGEDATLLRQVFPDGVGRFWGAIEPKKQSGAKAVAVRNCRVGDEVLFYGEKKFIARATILAKFHNPDLAREVWGARDDGAIWEHMIALGDLMEFEADALPLLAAIKGPSDKLWGMQLVTVSDRTLLLGKVDPPSAPVRAALPAPRSQKAAASTMTEKTLLHTLATLRTYTRSGGPSLHKPLALLWSIGRVAAREERLAPWKVFENGVGGLLADFGGNTSHVTPHYPFTRLRGSGVWDVQGIHVDVQDPSPTALLEADAKAGFTDDADRLLRRSHRARAKAVGLLRAKYFADVDQRLLFERVGLGGYLTASGSTEDDSDVRAAKVVAVTGPVPRQATSGTRPVRDPDNVRDVKRWHEDLCQVCGEPLEVLLGRYSEAAHIQGIGSPHDGPDTTANMLCLCPNHHRQFDGLGIYVDAQWEVRRTKDDSRVSQLRRDPRHRIGSGYVEYHRMLCGKND